MHRPPPAERPTRFVSAGCFAALLALVVAYATSMASQHTHKTEGGAAAAAAAAAASSSSSPALGYPSLLPGSLAVPPRSDPFWYDDMSPTDLWESHLSRATPATPVQPMQLRKGVALPPKPAGHLRFVAISDTHNYHSLLPLPPPSDAQIDVLLHAGDFSNVGEQPDIDAFTLWIRSMPIKYKVVIAGNHDVSFDEGEYLSKLNRRFNHRTTVDSKAAKAALTKGFEHQPFGASTTPFPAFAAGGGVAYLEDSGISIEGIRIWGSPWQPEFYSWGFNLPTGAPLREKWSLIPSDTEVLVTHGPPLGHGDLCLPHRNRAGCVDLLMECTTRIHPRFHVFGHIHEGYGQSTNGETDFINASNCNLKYDPKNLNPPIVFDVPIPAARAQAAKQTTAAAEAGASSAAGPSSG